MKHTTFFKKVIIVILLTSISVLSSCYYTPPKGYTKVADVTIKNAIENHPGNQFQSSETHITVVDELLYIWGKDTKLYVLEQGELKTVYSPPQYYRRFDLCGEFVYYVGRMRDDDPHTGKYSLWCYEISSGEMSCILADISDVNLNYSIRDDNHLYLPSVNPNEYYILNGPQCTGPHSITIGHRFGENFYCSNNNIYKDSGGESIFIMELPEDSRPPIPYENGLIVRTAAPEELLSYVTPNGEWVELITTDGLYVDTSLNYYEDTVYFSFLRIGQEGFKGPTTYDNDTQSGTYKIDMKSFEVQKINDQFYESMYIFDDTGLYVLDRQQDIYKLDFDGNVVTPVLVRITADSSPVSWREFLSLPE